MTVNKTDSNDKNYADKKQTKGRILRAKDIIPGTQKRNSEKNEQVTEIPKFDLAEEILAEQRKITSIKRKAPGQSFDGEPLRTVEPQREVESTGYAAGWPRPALPEQEQIIAEIVARDIKTLRDGNIIY